MKLFCSLRQISPTSDKLDNAYKPFLLYAETNSKRGHSTMAIQEESLFQCLTVNTDRERLVLMPVTRAGPAFMFSQYHMLVSLLMRLERMMKMSTCYFVMSGVLLLSKEWQEMPLALILTGFLLLVLSSSNPSQSLSH